MYSLGWIVITDPLKGKIKNLNFPSGLLCYLSIQIVFAESCSALEISAIEISAFS